MINSTHLSILRYLFFVEKRKVEWSETSDINGNLLAINQYNIIQFIELDRIRITNIEVNRHVPSSIDFDIEYLFCGTWDDGFWFFKELTVCAE